MVTYWALIWMWYCYPLWGRVQYGGSCQTLHTEHGISLFIHTALSAYATSYTCYSTVECLETSRFALTDDVHIKALEDHIGHYRTQTIIVNLTNRNGVNLGF
jgi:hypothetical protein